MHDIANANILTLEKSRADYEVFNVGTGRKISIGEIADILIKLYKKSLKPQIAGTYREGDIRHCYADISKISKLGFVPKIEFETGIRELVGWVESQDASNISDKFETANEELRVRKLA